MVDIDAKLKITVTKTIEALSRIERFIEKYGDQLDSKSIDEIANKVKQLQQKVNNKK